MTTKTNMALAELTEKGADSDLLREMIQYVTQRMMGTEVESLCAAAYAERNPEPLNSRNGHRERLWETRCGRHFPERGRHNTSGGRSAARADRRVVITAPISAPSCRERSTSSTDLELTTRTPRPGTRSCQ